MVIKIFLLSLLGATIFAYLLVELTDGRKYRRWTREIRQIEKDLQKIAEELHQAKLTELTAPKQEDKSPE